MPCPACDSFKVESDGVYHSKLSEDVRQKYRCLDCGKKFSERTGTIEHYDKMGSALQKKILRNVHRWRSTSEWLEFLGVYKKPFYHALDILAKTRQAEFEHARFYAGVVLRKGFGQLWVRFGFNRHGVIVDVDYGKFDEPLENYMGLLCDERSAAKLLRERYLPMRSRKRNRRDPREYNDQWTVLRRSILFSLHYNEQLFRKNPKIRKGYQESILEAKVLRRLSQIDSKMESRMRKKRTP